MKSRSPSESRPSILLAKEENELVFKLIGQRCQSLATAVVQLFTTEGPAHNQWYKRDTGILCLIKDHQKRSYYFRIYCMQRRCMIWEHEVYNQIEYKSPRPYLHTFEAEVVYLNKFIELHPKMDCVVAFNFANEEEAATLKSNLTEKIELRKQRREDRRQKSLQNTARNSTDSSILVNANNNTNTIHPNRTFGTTVNTNINTNIHNGIISPLQQKTSIVHKSHSKKKTKIDKRDIGLPYDFKHVSHVGWDVNKGFDVENLPEKDMRNFFTRAGVSDSQLQDKDTRDFIYDFIKSHGGVDAVKEALVEDEKTIKVTKVTNQSTPYRHTPPPVPLRNPIVPVAPPVQKDVNGSRNAPPPPPPPARAPPPPPPPPQRQLPPPPPQVVAIPANVPPPPPPPPMAPSFDVNASVATEPPLVQQDMRAALMESIRSGRSLKHIEMEQKHTDGEKRQDLLQEIRQGIGLKPVVTNSNDHDRKSDDKTGLAGALARALEERSKVLHDSSDSDRDDTTSDGDDWED